MTVEEWAAEAKKSGGKNLPVRRFVGEVAGEVDVDGLVPVIMSTSGEDRTGDTVSDDGWVLTEYLKNPVLLWSHDQSIPAIGRMEGLSTGPLRGGMRFTPREVNAFGDMIGGLYRHGFLKAGSVGFLPVEWDFTDHGVRFKRQVLLEHSCCNVPMNSDALVSARSKGIDVGLFLPFAEKALDGDKAAPFWLPKEQAWMIHRSLTGPRVQVPAAAPVGPDLSAVLSELKGMREVVEGLRMQVASMKAVQPVAPAPKPSPEVKGNPFVNVSHAAIARAVAEATRKELASITGRAEE